MKAKYFAICGTLILFALVATLIVYPYLPDQVPIHWGPNGADGYGPRWLEFIIGPGIMMAFMLLFAVIPRVSPKYFEVESFQPTYLQYMLILVCFMGYVYGITLWETLTGNVDVMRALMLGISVLIIVIGNLLGKIRRNFFIGIRTPWTLTDDRVWYSTHRIGAKAMVISGFICFCLALVGSTVSVSIWLLVFLAGTILPALYSFWYYIGMKRRGELDS